MTFWQFFTFYALLITGKQFPCSLQVPHCWFLYIMNIAIYSVTSIFMGCLQIQKQHGIAKKLLKNILLLFQLNICWLYSLIFFIVKYRQWSLFKQSFKLIINCTAAYVSYILGIQGWPKSWLFWNMDPVFGLKETAICILMHILFLMQLDCYGNRM